MAMPCAGLKVLDFAQGYGAIAGMVLADFGAEVVKIEPPGGDFIRPDSASGCGMPAFLQWNRGKRSVVLDLKTEEDKANALALAGSADIIIENFRPGVMGSLGLGYQEVASRNPEVIYLSISAFGQTGKYSRYKGYEGIVSAKCGQHLIQGGYRGDEPHYDAVFKSSFGSTVQGLIGVLAALHVRTKTGVGQKVEATMVQANYVYSYGGIRFLDDPSLYKRFSGLPGKDPRNNSSIGFRIGECADGKTIQSGSASGRIFENMMRALEIDDYFTDPLFKEGLYQPTDEVKTRLISLIDAAYKKRPLAEWTRIFDEQDVGYALFSTTQEFMDYPQVLHNGHVIEVDDPTVGSMKQVGPLVKFEGQEWRWPGPAPSLGEHTKEALSELSPSGQESNATAAVDPPLPAGALNGVTVIDLSTYAAAPGGPGILADLGARVIKVEPLGGEPMAGSIGDLWLKIHRGKERICLDLKSREGKDILFKLVARGDIFVHNFRPGVPERLGVSFETLRAVNPRLVYLYASAFGSRGPDARRPAFDPVVSAMAGAESLQAGEGNPPQDKRVSDHTAYLGVALAMLLGLRARELTGEAQCLETSMLGSAALLFSDDFLRYEGKPPRPLPDKGQYGLGPLYRLYRAKDGWVFLAAVRDEEWRAFCDAVGRTEWADDPRFGSVAQRQSHKEELAALLEPLFLERSAQQWEEDLQARDVACAVASNTWPDFLFDDWDGAGYQATVEYSYPVLGRVRHSGAKVHVLKTPGNVGDPEILGESTRKVLQELGYTPAQMEDLKARKVIDWKED